MAYGDLKHLPRRTTPDKILSDKTFNFAKNKNMTDINVKLLQWLTNVFMKNLLPRVQINLLLTKEHELILKINNEQISHTNQLLKDLKNIKCILKI